MTKRFIKFIKELTLWTLISVITLLILSIIFLAVIGELSGWDSILKMFKAMFLFFGAPFLIAPLISSIWPEIDEPVYIACGIYYGGAILASFLGIPVGFLVSSFVAYLYIVKMELKK